MSGSLSKAQVDGNGERFSVRYEVRPESTVLRNHSIRTVGFCLELYGRDEEARPLSPGDERSKEIYRRLRGIALQIVPQQDPACRYELGEFRPALHYENHTSHGPEVQFDIRILHKVGFELPLDAEETRALREMEDHLKELGICRQK